MGKRGENTDYWVLLRECLAEVCFVYVWMQAGDKKISVFWDSVISLY